MVVAIHFYCFIFSTSIDALHHSNITKKQFVNYGPTATDLVQDKNVEGGLGDIENANNIPMYGDTGIGASFEGERGGGSDGVSSFVNGASDQPMEQLEQQQSNFEDAGTSRQALEGSDSQGNNIG